MPVVASLAAFFLVDAAIFVWLVMNDLESAARMRLVLATCSFVAFMMGSLIVATAVAAQHAKADLPADAGSRKRAAALPGTALRTPEHMSRFLVDSVQEVQPQGMTVGLLWVKLQDGGIVWEGPEAADLRDEAGRRLIGAFRVDDCVAYLGHGEFVVIVSRLVGRSALPALKKRAARTLSNLRPSATAPLSVLVGSALHPVDGYLESDLVEAARTDAVLRGETGLARPRRIRAVTAT